MQPVTQRKASWVKKDLDFYMCKVTAFKRALFVLFHLMAPKYSKKTKQNNFTHVRPCPQPFRLQFIRDEKRKIIVAFTGTVLNLRHFIVRSHMHKQSWLNYKYTILVFVQVEGP